jgi:hypothetical protein
MTFFDIMVRNYGLNLILMCWNKKIIYDWTIYDYLQVKTTYELPQPLGWG